MKRLVNAENKDHVPYDFGLGSLVLLTWTRITNKVNENKRDEKLDFSTQSTETPFMFGSVKNTSDLSYALVLGLLWFMDWFRRSKLSSRLVYLIAKKFVPLKQFIGSKKVEDIIFLISPTCTLGRKGKCEYQSGLLRYVSWYILIG